MRLGGAGGAPAEVIVTEPTGSDTYVIASLAGHDVTFVLKDRTPLTAGQRITLSVTEAPVHFFDLESSLRIE
jgi:multiple sugar transport system ATP-binding protein